METADFTAFKQLLSLPPEYIALFIMWQFYRLALTFVEAVKQGLERTKEIAENVAEIRHAMHFQYPPYTVYPPSSGGEGNKPRRHS